MKMEERGQHLPFVSQNLIKEKLSRDMECDIVTTSLKVSLLCPVSVIKTVTLWHEFEFWDSKSQRILETIKHITGFNRA